MGENLGQLIWPLLGLMAICLGVALMGLGLIARQIRRLNVPEDADFFTTMRYVPLLLVLLLDLLDFSLDIFSAPISWIVLSKMGLPNLRNKAVVEALIPATNIIPTFTIGWVMARILNLGEQPDSYGYQEPQRRRVVERRDPRDAPRYRPEPQRRRRTIDMDEP